MHQPRYRGRLCYSLHSDVKSVTLTRTGRFGHLPISSNLTHATQMTWQELTDSCRVGTCRVKRFLMIQLTSCVVYFTGQVCNRQLTPLKAKHCRNSYDLQKVFPVYNSKVTMSQHIRQGNKKIKRVTNMKPSETDVSAASVFHIIFI